jgi:putative membrane protein
MMNGYGDHAWGMGWGWILGLIVIVVIVWIVVRTIRQGGNNQ